MEQDSKSLEFIKKILNNISLLRWVKKFSADGLQEKLNAENFDVETSEDSISIADTGLVKMFFSSSRFKGKTYISLDIKHIKEVLALVDGEGRLIIGERDEGKRLCYIQSGDNVVVIAPTTEESEVIKKPKKKSKKKVEEVEEEIDEEEEEF